MSATEAREALRTLPMRGMLWDPADHALTPVIRREDALAALAAGSHGPHATNAEGVCVGCGLAALPDDGREKPTNERDAITADRTWASGYSAGRAAALPDDGREPTEKERAEGEAALEAYRRGKAVALPDDGRGLRESALARFDAERIIDESWRDTDVLAVVKSGKPLGSMARSRIVEWYEAATAALPDDGREGLQEAPPPREVETEGHGGWNTRTRWPKVAALPDDGREGLDEAWAAVEAVLPEGWGVGIEPQPDGWYEVGASGDTTWAVLSREPSLPAALRGLAKSLLPTDKP